MKRLTVKETVRLHRKLWDILARTGGSSKYEAMQKDPELREWVGSTRCFFCAYDGKRKNDCSACIGDWGNFVGVYHCYGLYRAWEVGKDVKQRKALAAQIRDIPIRKKYQRYVD